MLYRKNGEYYSIRGFFNHLDNDEITIKNNYETLNNSTIQRLWHFGQFNKVNDSNIIDLYREHYQIPNNHIIEYFGFHYIVLKKENLSIFSEIKYTLDLNKCIQDYINLNGHIPIIKSQGRYIHESINGKKENSYFCQKIDQKQFDIVMRKYDEKPIIEKAAYVENEETDKTIFSQKEDYYSAGKRLNIDLFELNKKIRRQAKLNGGFEKFTYNGIEYEIPKHPMKIWEIQFKNRTSIENCKNKINAYLKQSNLNNWKSISPTDIKISDDCPIHSDWWIGAGFPIFSYDRYNYKKFNKELYDFVFGRSINLENLVFLSKGSNDKIIGDLKYYNAQNDNIDDINEGDIVICPNANIDYDMCLKKVGKSGAIIVEIGNQVAHLSIVGKELGYNVIFLPNAYTILEDKIFEQFEIDINKSTIKLSKDQKRKIKIK